MSGHSKWSTIKRQKAVNDNARGQLFSKLSKAITVAVKTGGGANPDSNYKLKTAIDEARAANMPKENIERAISKGESSQDNLEEVTYEGFGPFGSSLIIDAATDNRNRTGQEIKQVLERSGGGLGGPGSASFNFDLKGFIKVKVGGNTDEMLLKLIDLGVEDYEEKGGALELYVSPDQLFEMKKRLEESGFEILKAELLRKPKTTLSVDESKIEKLHSLLESLSENEDVQKIAINANL